ncbi:MAG: ABC transporter permease, partial [Rhizobiales bacterium]|nr:ABC transporter permease [Hyphomicrobiales bacterium]
MSTATTLPVAHAGSRIGAGRLIGGVMLGLVILAALAGPWLIAEDPARQNLLRILQPPGGDHPLGTDHLGRSLAARLAAATRLSLGLALASVLSAAIPGTLLGI